MEGKDSHANGNLLAKVNEESEKKRHCEPFELSLVPHTGSSDGPFMMPLLLVPNVEEANPKASIVLAGTARRGRTGPAVGAVDIGLVNMHTSFEFLCLGSGRILMGVLSIEAAFQSIPNRSFRYPTLAAAAALAASQMMLELVLPHL